MTSHLIIELTSDCNMHCPYCYINTHHRTDPKSIRETVSSIIESFKINRITLTGGEPLIEHETLSYILKYARKKSIDTCIITNGRLLNQEKIDEFKKLKVSVRLSIDGFSGFGKLPSKSLIKLIRSNIDYFKEVSKVITAENSEFLWEDFQKLASLGFEDFDLIPEMYIEWKKDKVEQIIDNMKKIKKHCSENNLRCSFNSIPGTKDRYLECENIRVLPDGNISLCLSLNCTGKHLYLNPSNLSRFHEFRESIILKAMEDIERQTWFNPSHKNYFCLVDLYYFMKYNKGKEKLMNSTINMFSEIYKALEEVNRDSNMNSKHPGI